MLNVKNAKDVPIKFNRVFIYKNRKSIELFIKLLKVTVWVMFRTKYEVNTWVIKNYLKLKKYFKYSKKTVWLTYNLNSHNMYKMSHRKKVT